MTWILIIFMLLGAVLYLLSRLSVERYPKAPWVWSRGWKHHVQAHNPALTPWYFERLGTEDKAGKEKMTSIFKNLKGLVWVRLGSSLQAENDLASFAWYILPTLEQPIYLLTGDGDLDVPSGLLPGVADKLLNHPLVLGWATQNYDGSLVYPKLRHLPIGLDLHSLGPELASESAKMLTMERISRLASTGIFYNIWKTRKPRIFLDLLSKSHPIRQEMEELLAGQPHLVFNTSRKSFGESMEEYASYQFAASPRGNGLDCHRTWELLLLNTVPIIQSSSLDGMFAHSPAIIIQDWKELLDPECIGRFQRQHERFLRLNPGYYPQKFLAPENWLKLA